MIYEGQINTVFFQDWLNPINSLNTIPKYIYTIPGFELTYFDSGNMMYFSFFTIQFFPPTQKIMIPKKVSVF